MAKCKAYISKDEETERGREGWMEGGREGAHISKDEDEDDWNEPEISTN